MKQHKKHSTNNTKHSKYKYTYYQNPEHYKTHIYTHPHIIKQVKTNTVQMKLSQYNQVPSV